jgi:hypothetical protein
MKQIHSEWPQKGAKRRDGVRRFVAAFGEPIHRIAPPAAPAALHAAPRVSQFEPIDPPFPPPTIAAIFHSLPMRAPHAGAMSLFLFITTI